MNQTKMRAESHVECLVQNFVAFTQRIVEKHARQLSLDLRVLQVDELGADRLQCLAGLLCRCHSIDRHLHRIKTGFLQFPHHRRTEEVTVRRRTDIEA